MTNPFRTRKAGKKTTGVKRKISNQNSSSSKKSALEMSPNGNLSGSSTIEDITESDDVRPGPSSGNTENATPDVTLTQPKTEDEAGENSTLDSTLGDEESDAIFEKVVEEMEREKELEEAEGSSAAQGSYAAVTKRRKISYLYALYVHKGTKNREALPKNMFKAFEAMIWKTREELLPEVDNSLQIEWITFENSIGIIICLDSHTAGFIKTLSGTFDYEGLKLRCWSKWERASAVVISFYVHSLYIKSLKQETALNRIFRMNQLDLE